MCTSFFVSKAFRHLSHFFNCSELITYTYVMITTMKSLFCHSLQRPLPRSNFTEREQSEQSRCLDVYGKSNLIILFYVQSYKISTCLISTWAEKLP
jgi:hypothetical protein